jgi:hypothetical protein
MDDAVLVRRLGADAVNGYKVPYTTKPRNLRGLVCSLEE